MEEGGEVEGEREREERWKGRGRRGRGGRRREKEGIYLNTTLTFFQADVSSEEQAAKTDHKSDFLQ